MAGSNLFAKFPASKITKTLSDIGGANGMAGGIQVIAENSSKQGSLTAYRNMGAVGIFVCCAVILAYGGYKLYKNN